MTIELYAVPAQVDAFDAANDWIIVSDRATVNGTGYRPFLTLAAQVQAALNIGLDSQITYNNGGVMAGHAGLTFDDTNIVLTVKGTGTPAALTDVLFQSVDTVNSYIQDAIQNMSAGVSASSDVVASSNVGTDTTNFVDMGINSSGWADGAWTINGANDAYLYSGSTGLAVGVGAAGQTLKLFTGGLLAANARMAFTDTAITLTPGARTSGSPTSFTYTAAADTGLATTAEAIDVHFNFARTSEHATGAIALQRAMLISAPTYSFVLGSTITNAATLAISGAPIAGVNATLTNSYALLVESGRSRINGQLQVLLGTPALAFTAAALTLSRDTDGYVFVVEAPNMGGVPAFSVQNVPLSTDLNTGKGFELKVTGEGSGRAMFYSDGKYAIGPGSTMRDTVLSRSGVSIFRVSSDGGTGVNGGGVEVLGRGSFGAALVSAVQFNVSQVIATTGSPTALRVTGGAHTTLTLSTEAVDFDFAANRTVQFATGALAIQRAALFRAPTYTFVLASTVTDVATVAITGAPIAGLNATFTNAMSLWVQGGMARFDGALAFAPGSAAAPGLSPFGDLDTGLYSVGANILGVATGGVLRLSINGTAFTSTITGIFPASTTAGSSARFPHGVAPTAPVDGDLWSTTAGFFIRVNGVTVGPLGSGSGGVTSVGLALPAEFTVSGSPVTTTGTLTGSWANQNANLVFAGPGTGVAAVPAFRALVAADIPGLPWSIITSGLPTTLAGYGITNGATNGAVTASGLTMTTATLLGRTTAATGAIEGITIGANLTLSAGVLSAAGGGSGTVTSVGITVPAFLSVVGSPVTTAGTLSVSFSGTAIPLANGGTGSTAFTAGSVVFSNGTVLTQDNANLFWDDTNNRLGIGTAAPGYPLTVVGKLTSSTGYILGFDLSLIPVVGGQSAVSTWWGMQLVGNQQSNVDYTPGNIYAAGDFSVIIPNMQAAAIGLIVRGQTSQTGNLIELRNIGGTGLAAFNAAGKLGIGLTAPTAYLHLTLGSTAAATAPLKFTAGVNMTVAEAGAMEWDGTNLYVTQTTGPTRKTLAFTDIVSIAANQVAYGSGTNAITGSPTFTFNPSTGLVVNLTGGTPAALPTGTVANFAMGNGNAGVTRIMAGTYMGTGGGFASFAGRSARGSISVPTALQLNDEMVRLAAWGYGATGFSAATRGYMSVFAAENWTDTAQGTRIGLFTTTPGGTSTTEKVRVWGDGGVQIGGTFTASTGPNSLLVSGVVAITPPASTGSPTRAFTLNAAAHTALTASTEFTTFSILGTAQQFATGAIATQRFATFTAPTYSFVLASTITNAATLAITGAPGAGTNATLTNTMSLWVQSGMARFDGPALVGAGTAAAPGLGLFGDSNTGLFSVGADNLGIATGGVLRFDVSTVAVTSTLTLVAPASVAGAASIRLPPGVAPTSPVDGDEWTTTVGRFIRINGVTTNISRIIFALTDAATIAVDAAAGDEFTVTLAGNRTMGAPTNPVNGRMMLFRIKQDATGSRTITWNAAYAFPIALPAPTLSTVANRVDYIGFVYDSTSAKWHCLSYIIGHT